MNFKQTVLTFSTLILITVGGMFVLAGDINNENDPTPNFYTLEDIYNLIHEEGSATEGDHTISPDGSQSTSATSSYSVSQIYADLANLIKRENVATGTVYLGVTGDYDNPDPDYATTTVLSSSLTPSGTPGESYGYSLEDIWNLINENTTTTAGAHSATPDGVPADSMHTTTEIYEALVSLIVADQVRPGITYLGVEGTYGIDFAGGDGTEGDPYQITSCVQLQRMDNYLDQNFILSNNIDCSDTVSWNEGEGFSPIGGSSSEWGGQETYFSGNFDGNGYVISDLYIYRDAHMLGLFSRVNNSTIQNLGLENIDISVAENDNYYVGGLIGSAGDNGSPVNISNVYVTGSVAGSWTGVAGLVGHAMNGTTISDCWTDTYVTVDDGDWSGFGGLVGLARYGDGVIITNSYALGDVEILSGTLGGAGGLVGEINIGIITNSYATGNVIGNDASAGGGGLIGYGDEVTITDSYATGDVSGHTLNDGMGNGFAGGLTGQITGNTIINNTYSTGAITDSANIGGLIGASGGGSVNESYWDIDTSGQATSAGGTGTTTVAMYKQATFVGWDFATIWDITEDSDYPFLR